MTKGKYVPPDGGWGWVIVIAVALSNVVLIPIIQNFGMIYGNTFPRLGISATQASIIMNLNQAFGMILGMMNGPLLRRFGYRKVAIMGNLLVFFGIVLTSFSTSFVHFIISYGMVTSVGMSIGIASNLLAINTYFREKRGRAMGVTLTLTGLGPILSPYFISYAMSIYGSEGAMLLIGALSLHSLVGALLLQPIKWHAQPVEALQAHLEKAEHDLINETIDAQESISLLGGSTEKNLSEQYESRERIRKLSRKISMASVEVNEDNVSVYGFEMPVSIKNGSILDLRGEEDSILKNEENENFQRKLSTGNLEFDYKRSNSFNEARSRKLSVSSSKFGDLLHSKAIIAECVDEEWEHSKISEEDSLDNEILEPPLYSQTPLPSIPSEPKLPPTPPPAKRRSWRSRLLQTISRLFDLDLLRDPIYVNIMLGMSFAIFAELNFSVLTPFILKEMRLTFDQIATMMSTLACSDLVLRALAPYIGEWLRKSTRVMYLVSLMLLIVARTALIFATGYTSKLIVALGLGIAKGLRTVYMTLVIPSHVPLEKLPNASSIQSLVNGFLLLTGGSFLGLLRDLSGSYTICIVFINCVTAITIILWLGEFTIIRIKRRRKLSSTAKLEQDIKTVESQ